MQFLLHGAIAPQSLIRHEHKTHLTAELDLGDDASAEQIIDAARAKQWEIITTDTQLAMAPFGLAKPFKRSIVYLQVSGGEAELSDAIDRLFTRYKRLTGGRLYTVTASRVKVRQLPTVGRGL